MVGPQRQALICSKSNIQLGEAISPPELPSHSKNRLVHLKHCRVKRIVIICSILCAVGLVAYLYIDHTIPEFTQYPVLQSYKQMEMGNRTDAVRFILLWNEFFGDARWMLPHDVNGPLFFRTGLNCTIAECVVTNERKFLPQVDMYDAVLFHTAKPFALIEPIPRRRLSKQLYVFALMESPSETKHLLRDAGNFYNLTMTYRKDSDIFWAYNNFVEKATGQRLISSENLKWHQAPSEYNDTNIWNLWPKKTKMAAWFVSHCETASRREQLVEEIQKYMEVDVFGKCGTQSCPKGTAECNTMLDEYYKFYFSFENSLCIDYITEKVYNAMVRNIVPVVYGGANYGQFLPPHSYINVEDYATVQDLVDYLVYLSENLEEYMRYFWWHQYYALHEFSPFCDLCQRLHQPNYLQKSQIYTNIEKWWYNESCRFQARIKF